MKPQIKHRFVAAALGLAALALPVVFSTPVQAANPVGNIVYAPNPAGDGDSNRMDAWVNWDASNCGAAQGLQCHTYMKIVSTRNNHIAGGWISGATGWNVTYAPKPRSMPVDWIVGIGARTSRTCESFRTVVEHYTEFWGQGGTFSVNASVDFKAGNVGAGYSFPTGIKVTTNKLTWASSWVSICPPVA
jgi:hypothetical protein